MYDPLLRRLYRIQPSALVYNMVPLAQTKWLLAGLRGLLLMALLRTAGKGRRPLWLSCFAAFLLFDLAPQVPQVAPRFPDSYFRQEPATLRSFPPDRSEYRLFPIADWVCPVSDLAPTTGYMDDNRHWALRNELLAQISATYGIRTIIDVDIDRSGLTAARDFATSVWEISEKPRPRDWIDAVAAMSNVWMISTYRRPSEIRMDAPLNELSAVKFLQGRHYPRYYFATQLVSIRDRHDFVRAMRTGHFPREAAFIAAPVFPPAAGRVLGTQESANRRASRSKRPDRHSW